MSHCRLVVVSSMSRRRLVRCCFGFFYDHHIVGWLWLFFLSIFDAAFCWVAPSLVESNSQQCSAPSQLSCWPFCVLQRYDLAQEMVHQNIPPDLTHASFILWFSHFVLLICSYVVWIILVWGILERRRMTWQAKPWHLRAISLAWWNKFSVLHRVKTEAINGITSTKQENSDVEASLAVATLEP